MQIVFKQEYLSSLYYNQTADKKHRFQPEVVKKYIKVVNILKHAKGVEDLYPFNSLNYEKLSGDKNEIEMAHKNFTPTHPGEVIKDELIARGIPQKDFAARIGVPYTMLNDILNERRALSTTIALYIESALGISAELLIGLQSDYSMQNTRNDKDVRRKMRSIKPYILTPVPAIATR